MHHLFRVSNAGDLFGSGARVGDYTIDREYSREDRVVTYEATHLVLPRKALLTVLGGAVSREAAVTLLREACLLEALSHTGIPRVFECGVLADRRPWVAFERVEGASLAGVLTQGPMGVSDLVGLVRDVADILHHAHSRGVIHKALTADSIVRTPTRQSSICVRGWSNARTSNPIELDARDDVYALGAIAFRALTGCLHTPNVSSTEWSPSAPAELTALIDVMLDATPRVRPTSDEVRERARWLATTIEQLTIEKPRWTPPNGLDRDTHEPVPTQSSSFSIRIGRTRTGH